MAKNGLDTSERSARLVPMVFPLLHGSATTRRGRPPDRALEGDEAPRFANQETLRARRPDVPPAPAPGAVALGLRQSDHRGFFVCAADQGDGIPGADDA